MDDAQFAKSLDQSIVRHARDKVRRGHWTEASAQSTARDEFLQLLPQGRRTPNHRFFTVMDAGSGGRVGEMWCTVRSQGGKLQFWIDWLWIDPALRRRGYATAVLRHTAALARREGADRCGLFVLSDNAPARTLYERLGFREESRRMILRFGSPRDPARWDIRSATVRRPLARTADGPSRGSPVGPAPRRHRRPRR
jgi:ribosomal protein S18 acetylase RimI-like enzyme